MTLLKKVDKICKCGHRLDPDHKNNKSFLGFKFNSRTKCNGKVRYDNISVPCCCHSFLDRRYPTKFDKAMMLSCFSLMVIVILFFGSMAIIISLGLDCHTDQCNKVFNKPLFTERQSQSLVLMFMIFIIWMAVTLMPFDYFKLKKRKIEPIQDDINEQKPS